MPVTTIEDSLINIHVDHDSGDEHDSDYTVNAFSFNSEDNVMHCYTQDQLINGRDTYETRKVYYVDGRGDDRPGPDVANGICAACGHHSVFHQVGTGNGVPAGQAYCDDRHARFTCNCTKFVSRVLTDVEYKSLLPTFKLPSQWPFIGRFGR